MSDGTLQVVGDIHGHFDMLKNALALIERNGGSKARIMVHGHSPVDAPRHYGNRINLDSGAGYGRPLTSAVFEDGHCWLLTADGRRPLLPDDRAS